MSNVKPQHVLMMLIFKKNQQWRSSKLSENEREVSERMSIENKPGDTSKRIWL